MKGEMDQRESETDKVIFWLLILFALNLTNIYFIGLPAGCTAVLQVGIRDLCNSIILLILLPNTILYI